jgi:hypothetical protein
MPSQAPHLRITFGGPFFTDEQWQCTIHMAFPPSLAGSEGGMIGVATAGLVTADAAIAAWLAGANNGVHKLALYQWVKCNAVKDGRYIDQGHTNLYTRGTPVTPTTFAGTDAGNMPPQMALCLSTKTSARSRGPGSHGRIFIPAQHLPLVGSTPRINSTALDSVRDAFKAFLNDLNVWPTGDSADWPYVAHVPMGSTSAYQVSSVSVGDCWDVQRSRSKQLKEVYHTATLT